MKWSQRKIVNSGSFRSLYLDLFWEAGKEGRCNRFQSSNFQAENNGVMICAAPSNTLVRDKNIFRPRGIFVIRACPSVQEVSLLEGERGHWILNNLENSTMVTGNRHQPRSVWGVSAFPRHILLMFQCHCVLGRFAKKMLFDCPPSRPPTLSGGPCRFF